MNVKILIFGTLFLLGNITLNALEVNREGISFDRDNTKNYIRKSVADELEECLLERGLDDDIVKDLVKKSISDDDTIVAIKIYNYLTAVKTVDYDTLIEKLATLALFGKKIDFEDYDSLVRMTQDISSENIKDTTLEKLSKVAMINKNLTSL